jgi:hypothetical protein
MLINGNQACFSCGLGKMAMRRSPGVVGVLIACILFIQSLIWDNTVSPPDVPLPRLISSSLTDLPGALCRPRPLHCLRIITSKIIQHRTLRPGTTRCRSCRDVGLCTSGFGVAIPRSPRAAQTPLAPNELTMLHIGRLFDIIVSLFQTLQLFHCVSQVHLTKYRNQI